MENVSKLFAIVVSTDQTSATLLISVTVSLTLDTGAGRSAASPPVHISALTSGPRVHTVLLCPGPHHAAVVLGVEHGPELGAVVVAAHQAAPTLIAVVAVPLSLLKCLQ